MVTVCTTHVREDECIYVLVGKPDGKRTVGRPNCRWGILLKWILYTEWASMDWIHLAQDMN
jgi:hypothetical protein